MSQSTKRDLVSNGYAFVILTLCLVTAFSAACIAYYYFVVCPSWESFRVKRDKHMRNTKNFILFFKRVENENNIDLEQAEPRPPPESVLVASQPVSDAAQPVSDAFQPVPDVSQPVPDVMRPVSNVLRPISDVPSTVSSVAEPVSKFPRPVSEVRVLTFDEISRIAAKLAILDMQASQHPADARYRS